MSAKVPRPPSKHSPFETMEGNAPPPESGLSLWGKAQTKTRNSIKLSQSFRTLRDMMGEAAIDSRILKGAGRIGEGAFAVVDKCVYRPETDVGHSRNVAVKRLKPDVFRSELDLNDFIREALLLKRLNHPNIVDVIGLGSDVERAQSAKGVSAEQIFIVSEFMNEGTLYSKIVRQMKTTQTIYTAEQGLKWLIQIARALKYLHNANPRVIHRDLKIENVMLSSDVPGAEEEIIAKLGDFGLHALIPPKSSTIPTQPSMKSVKKVTRRFLSQARSIKHGSMKESTNNPARKSNVNDLFRLSGRTGSLMYMAPEVLKSERYNEKADVYSFAIVMYEVLQKCMLLAFVSIRGAPSEVDQYIESVLAGFRPYVPSQWPKELRELLGRCWSGRIQDRPSMDDVLDTLQRIQLSAQVVDEKMYDYPGCLCCRLQ